MAVPVPRPRVHVTNNPFVRPDDYTPDRVHERTDDAVVRDALPNNGRRGSDGGDGGGGGRLNGRARLTRYGKPTAVD